MPAKLTRLLREPLVHFLAIGAALFLYWHFFGDRQAASSQSILITPAHVERLAQVWTKTHLRPPTAEELAGLVDQEIDEEILYRQAVALGLDRDDLIIRRRLATKMEFLTDDLVEAANPTDDELQAFLLSHAEKFSSEPLTTFSQVFLDRSKRGEQTGAEAQRLLSVLKSNALGAGLLTPPGAAGSGDPRRAPVDWTTLGDPLPVAGDYKRATPADVARVFGREFPKKLALLPVGQWSGPVESGFGIHLVLIRERVPGKTPPLSEVRDAVLSEWRTAKRQELTAQFRQQRRASFKVNIEWPDWAREAAVAKTTKGAS
jgi:hypothetical protein